MCESYTGAWSQGSAGVMFSSRRCVCVEFETLPTTGLLGTPANSQFFFFRPVCRKILAFFFTRICPKSARNGIFGCFGVSKMFGPALCAEPKIGHQAAPLFRVLVGVSPHPPSSPAGRSDPTCPFIEHSIYHAFLTTRILTPRVGIFIL